MSVFNLGAPYGESIKKVSGTLIFIALAIIYFWFGGMKFTAYEAKGLVSLVSHSPFLSWMYAILSVRGFGFFLGILEWSIGLLIAARLFSPKFSVIGGLLSMGLFFVTVSFMFSTPGVIQPDLGFPAITVPVGQFLLKDIGLFAASVWVAGDSLVAIHAKQRT